MILSSTLIKNLFHKGDLLPFCPKKVFRVCIKKDLDHKSLAMLQGNYFETLCLGSGRDGEKTTDLPRKRNGEKTITQIRIETQSRKFHELAQVHQIIVTEANVQVSIRKKLADNIYLTGNLDLYPVALLDPELGYVMAIIDTKLTKTLHNSFGHYCWAIPQQIDDLQAQIYMLIIEDIDFDINPHLNKELFEVASKHAKNTSFYYWVFSHFEGKVNGKYVPLENAFFPVERSELKRAELMETLRKSYKVVKYYNERGWDKTFPSKENCTHCPLRDSCSDYYFLDTKKGDISAPSH